MPGEDIVNAPKKKWYEVAADLLDKTGNAASEIGNMKPKMSIEHEMAANKKQLIMVATFIVGILAIVLFWPSIKKMCK